MTNTFNLFEQLALCLYHEEKFYSLSDAQNSVGRVRAIVNTCPVEEREYMMKVALLAHEWGAELFPLAVLDVAFNHDMYKSPLFCRENGKSILREYADKIICSGADIAYITTFQLEVFGKPIPMMFRKCLKNKLETLEASKLCDTFTNRTKEALKDAIKLMHPNESKRGDNVLSDILGDMQDTSIASKTKKHIVAGSVVNYRVYKQIQQDGIFHYVDSQLADCGM